MGECKPGESNGILKQLHAPCPYARAILLVRKKQEPQVSVCARMSGEGRVKDVCGGGGGLGGESLWAKEQGA